MKMTSFLVGVLMILTGATTACSAPTTNATTTITPPSTQPFIQPSTQPASDTGGTSSSTGQVNAGTTTGTVATTVDVQKLVDVAVGRSLAEFQVTLETKVQATLNSKIDAQLGLIAKTITTTNDSHNANSGTQSGAVGSSETSGPKSPAFTFTGSGAYLMGGCILLAAVAAYYVYSNSHYKNALKTIVGNLPSGTVDRMTLSGPYANTVLKMLRKTRA